MGGERMHQAETMNPGMAKQWSRRRENAAAGAAAGQRWIARRLPLAVCFFLLSLAQCVQVPSPYAICFLAALLTAGIRPRGALIGLSGGLLIRVISGLPWDEWQYLACLLCFPLLRKPPEKAWQLPLICFFLLLGRAIPGMAMADQALTVILYLASILIGTAAAPALRRAADILKARAWDRLTPDDLLCLALPGLLMLSGAGRFFAFGVNIGCALAACAALLIGWLCGCAAGACAGMACGLALTLGGQNALLLIDLSLGAMIAGLFQGKNRLLASGMFLLTGVTATYLIAYGFSLFMFLGALAGCVLFCLIPPPLIKKAGLFIRRLRWAQPRENAYVRLKMQRWVRSIECIAQALPLPRREREDSAQDADALAQRLCEGCERQSICWQDRCGETQTAFRALTEENLSPEEELDRINASFSACLRIGKIPAALTRLAEEKQRQAQRVLCAEYEREMLKTHLTALAQAAERISLEGMTGDEEEAYWTAQAEEALQSLRFPGHTAFVKRFDGRMTVCLQCDPLALRPSDSATLAQRLGLQLQADLTVTEQQSDRILLEEAPPLRLTTGMATVSAGRTVGGRREKDRPDNGDAVLTLSLPGGRELLALSDGMGHGTDAQTESRKTLELLSLCMEAGYSRLQAITAVNGTMLSAASGEKFATVDLCLVDLWTGEAAMNKLGACQSLLIQGQKIKTIEGAALPLGILEHVVPMEHSFSLGDGDTLILLSDGVADAFGDEDELLSLLRDKRAASPQRLADALLRAALAQWDGVPPDDMTVLCARMEERATDERL